MTSPSLPIAIAMNKGLRIRSWRPNCLFFSTTCSSRNDTSSPSRSSADDVVSAPGSSERLMSTSPIMERITTKWPLPRME
ncbi:hypothetical protein H6P81_013614 [Aristolochia fimbriata]|uniref:Uncharacterized protein n=1 Tax=Aristolochia fimbriata TaxID=158543 RepID=A0AAV7EGF7_ARIFI|nr:hypothetical protein H6P81_013614 [Aristolochia fimbriata]